MLVLCDYKWTNACALKCLYARAWTKFKEPCCRQVLSNSNYLANNWYPHPTKQLNQFFVGRTYECTVAVKLPPYTTCLLLEDYKVILVMVKILIHLVLIVPFVGVINAWLHWCILWLQRWRNYLPLHRISQRLHSSGQTILDTDQCNGRSFTPLQGNGGKFLKFVCLVFMLQLRVTCPVSRWKPNMESVHQNNTNQNGTLHRTYV